MNQLATPAVTILSLRCTRCGHNWIPRTANPKECPACKSPYWNRPRQRKARRRPASRLPKGRKR